MMKRKTLCTAMMHVHVRSLMERIPSQLHEGSSIFNVELIGFWTGTRMSFHEMTQSQNSPKEFVTKSLFNARIWLIIFT